MEGSKQRCVRNRGAGVSKGDDLPLDMIFDILSKLPIKSIMRFRIVCKTWDGLTQDPHFIDMQSGRSNNHPFQLILPSSGRVADSSVNSLLLLDTEAAKTRQICIKEMKFNDPHISCSCNGLLCISSFKMLSPVFMCNPITEECVVLPSSKSELALLNHQISLGFDPSSNKYKVVRAYTYLKKNEINRFEIITLGESKWRKLKFPLSMRECILQRAVYWNGSLHWRVSSKGDRPDREIILAFDLSDEKFHTIFLPPTLRSCLRDLELVVLDEYLTLVEHKSNSMILWKVIGNNTEGYSVWNEQTYDMHVRWSGCFRYMTICRPNNSSYLLQVSYAMYESRNLKSHFVHFFPEMAQYFQLDIPGLPDYFRTICFKPSLVSPKALLGSSQKEKLG